jgi:hypothetical protein
MLRKRILCPERLRRVPEQFSWVDHRLVRDGRIRGLSHGSLALYLFLVTVGDADGLSFYADTTIGSMLALDSTELDRCRRELCRAGLAAYSRPFYQVLSLDQGGPALCEYPHPSPRRLRGDPVPLNQVLRTVLGGAA